MIFRQIVRTPFIAPREKVGAVFYIPDFREIQNPRAFPNRPERWRDNPEDAGDFSPGKGRLSRYAPMHFCRGVAPSFPPIPQGMGNTIVATEEKGGSTVLYSRLHENPNPKGFPKPPGAMAGQSGKRGRFFSRRGLTLPLYTGAFLQRGGPFFSSIPNGMGIQNSHFFCKRWE